VVQQGIVVESHAFLLERPDASTLTAIFPLTLLNLGPSIA